MEVTSRSPMTRFALQIWPQDIGDGRVEWRGKVHHLDSREARYFRDWPTMLSFIEAALGEGPLAAPSLRDGQQS